MTGQGQKASAHIERCCHGYCSLQSKPLRYRLRRHRPASRESEVELHRGDGTLHMGSIRGKAHPLPNTHMETVSTPVGRWMKVQGMFKMQTPTPPNCAQGSTQSVQRGDGRNVLERSKGEQHINCFISVHVRVDQRRFASSVDEDATTLPGKTEARLLQRGDGTSHRGFDFAGKLTACHTQIWRRSANLWGAG